MKKFLSLVLALVMTFALVTVSAGASSAAKDFTDGSKITYKKAVDVVSACDIIDGYATGEFNPTGTLTRGAASKIICNMILGPTTASALGVNAKPFTDVAVDNVFAGYIAYCSQQGIINGYADKTFKPAGLVTGNQFMKMLLGALGYDGTIEGFTGDNWTVAVMKLAKNLELDDGNDAFVGSKAMTREEACLYAFNTLCATMVEYEDNSTVVVGDVTISNKSKAKDVTCTLGKGNDGNVAKDGLVQFAEKYFSKLSNKPDTDDFCRPATTWVYDKKDVGTYADDADNSMVIGSAKNLKTVLTDGDYLDYDIEDVNAGAEVYVNGAKIGTYNTLSTTALGVGDKVEAFLDDDDNVELVVVTRYVAVEIDEIDTDLNSTYTKKGATCSIDLKEVDSGDALGTLYDAYDGNSDLVLPGFDAKTYTEGAVIAIAPLYDATTGKWSTSNVILDSYVAGKVTGVIKSYSASSAYVYVDGTKYKFAAEMYGVKDGYDADTDYDVYTTAEGYALAIVGVDTADLGDVYYVVGVYANSGSYASTVKYAQAVNVTTGEVKEFKLEAKDQPSGWNTALNNATTSAGVQRIDGLYTFSDDKETNSSASNEKYNANAWYGDADYSYSIAKTGSTTYALDGAVTKDSSSIKLVSANTTTYANSSIPAATAVVKKYINSATAFLTLEDKGDDLDVTTATGLKKCAAADADVAVVVYEDDSNKAAYVLYVGDSFDSSIGVDDVVFLSGDQDFDVNNDNDTAADLYFMDTKTASSVVLAGKKTVGNVAYTAAEAQGFYTYSQDSDDIYTLTAVSYISADVTSNTDGYAKELLVTAYEDGSNILTADHFDDVSYAGATVIDTRGDDADDDVYTAKITSVADLNKAFNKVDNYSDWTTAAAKGIVLDVCVEDGDITFIAVRAIRDADVASGGNPNANVDTSIKSVALGTDKKVTLTLNGNVAANTNYSYTVYKYMEATDKYVEAATGTVAVTSGTATVTSSALTLGTGIYFVAIGGVESANVTIA